MPRHRQRGTLDSGPMLDLARMIPRGASRPGRIISGTFRFSTGLIVSYRIHLEDYGGELTLALREGSQSFRLQSEDRHLGGRQYYIVCPRTWRRVRKLYCPYGARSFASRHAWGTRRMGYTSQFLDRTGRAWRTKSKIKNRLLGDQDPDEWDLPPKPKWMRWSTYNRLEAKYDAAEEALDYQCALALARLIKWGG